jgi:hypothetical protein
MDNVSRPRYPFKAEYIDKIKGHPAHIALANRVREKPKISPELLEKLGSHGKVGMQVIFTTSYVLEFLWNRRRPQKLALI